MAKTQKVSLSDEKEAFYDKLSSDEKAFYNSLPTPQKQFGLFLVKLRGIIFYDRASKSKISYFDGDFSETIKNIGKDAELQHHLMKKLKEDTNLTNDLRELLNKAYKLKLSEEEFKFQQSLSSEEHSCYVLLIGKERELFKLLTSARVKNLDYFMGKFTDHYEQLTNIYSMIQSIRAEATDTSSYKKHLEASDKKIKGFSKYLNDIYGIDIHTMELSKENDKTRRGGLLGILTDYYFIKEIKDPKTLYELLEYTVAIPNRDTRSTHYVLKQLASSSNPLDKTLINSTVGHLINSWPNHESTRSGEKSGLLINISAILDYTAVSLERTAQLLEKISKITDQDIEKAEWFNKDGDNLSSNEEKRKFLAEVKDKIGNSAAKQLIAEHRNDSPQELKGDQKKSLMPYLLANANDENSKNNIARMLEKLEESEKKDFLDKALAISMRNFEKETEPDAKAKSLAHMSNLLEAGASLQDDSAKTKLGQFIEHLFLPQDQTSNTKTAGKVKASANEKFATLLENINIRSLSEALAGSRTASPSGTPPPRYVSPEPSETAL